MKISTKGLYAVRFMLNLAERGGDKLVSLKEVSEAESVSKKYLEQIVPNLVSAQLVKSVRGAAGGYRFVRQATSLSLMCSPSPRGRLRPFPALPAKMISTARNLIFASR